VQLILIQNHLKTISSKFVLTGPPLFICRKENPNGSNELHLKGRLSIPAMVERPRQRKVAQKLHIEAN
jgi:hypothetical protein